MREEKNKKQLFDYLLRHSSEVLFKKLNSEDIFFVPLKGIVFKDRYYESLESRNSNDIDILINEKDSLIVRKVLKDLGYSPKNNIGYLQKKVENFLLHSEEYIHESTGIEIDLHSKLAEKYLVDIKLTNDFIASCTLCKTDNYLYYYPSIEYNFVFLCIHAFKNNFVEFQNFNDLLKLSLINGFNREEVLEISNRNEIGKVVVECIKRLEDETYNKIFLKIRNEYERIRYYKESNTTYLKRLSLRFFLPFGEDWHFFNYMYVRFFIFPIYFIIKPIKSGLNFFKSF